MFRSNKNFLACVILLICPLFLVLVMIAVSAKGRHVRTNAERPSSAIAKDVLFATVRHGRGTGCIVGQSNDHLLILSAKHVEPGAVSIWPYDREYGNSTIAAEHPTADLALVWLPYVGKPPGKLRIAKKPPGTETLMSAGCPKGNDPTIAFHKITGTTTPYYLGFLGRFYSTDQRLYPGCSGGPLCNPAGEVVGVCSFTSDTSAGFASLDEIHALCRIAGLASLYDQ